MTYHLPPEELKQAAERELFREEVAAFNRGHWHTMQTISPTLDKALEVLESVQWVDVKDRLPRAYETGIWDGKRSDFVLIKDSDEAMLIARVYEGFMDGSHFEEWADEKEYELEVNKVTHWMPLPDTAKITEAINEIKKLKG